MNIYRAKRITHKDNTWKSGYFHIGQLIIVDGRMLLHTNEDNEYEIDPSTLEVVKLDLNDTQRKVLQQEALSCFKSLLDTIDEFTKWIRLVNTGEIDYLELAGQDLDYAFELFNASRELLKGVL